MNVVILKSMASPNKEHDKRKNKASGFALVYGEEERGKQRASRRKKQHKHKNNY